jgi:alkylated DNA repair dioxygenase AlkB
MSARQFVDDDFELTSVSQALPPVKPEKVAGVFEPDIVQPDEATIEALGLRYVSNFFPMAEADPLFEELLKLPWHQHVYRMYGKPVPAPRHYVWMGGDGYQSPKTVGDVFVHPWTPEVLSIKERVEAVAGVTFNSCNVNLYKDETQYIGWHADGEKEGSWDFPIASVSFGSSRDFQVRKGKHGKIHTMRLEHGSLVIMPTGFQREWLHKVRKSSKPCGPRVNLTFRHQIV